MVGKPPRGKGDLAIGIDVGVGDGTDVGVDVGVDVGDTAGVGVGSSVDGETDALGARLRGGGLTGGIGVDVGVGNGISDGSSISVGDGISVGRDADSLGAGVLADVRGARFLVLLLRRIGDRDCDGKISKVSGVGNGLCLVGDGISLGSGLCFNSFRRLRGVSILRMQRSMHDILRDFGPDIV